MSESVDQFLFQWREMSLPDLAQSVGLLGPRIVRVGEVYWAEIRPCFYRPLLPFVTLEPPAARPFLGRLGGVQYPVDAASAANSTLNYVAFEETARYNIATLDKNRRRQVRLAAKEFTVRTLPDPIEFKRLAHSVYLDFQARTGYRVGAERRDPARFAAWTDSLYRLPGILILGGFRGSELGGVSLSYRVGPTVFYATFFCHETALAGYLSDLMLHVVRLSAASAPGVTRVFAGMLKGVRGLDDFYLHRGANVIRQPARLEINPAAAFMLARFAPGRLGQMRGELAPGSPHGA